MKRILVALMLIASTGAVFAQSSATYLKLRVVDSIRLGDRNVKEFSSDPALTDSADNILPTQSAVKAAIAKRVNDTAAALRELMNVPKPDFYTSNGAFTSHRTVTQGQYGLNMLSEENVNGTVRKTRFYKSGVTAWMQASQDDGPLSTVTVNPTDARLGTYDPGTGANNQFAVSPAGFDGQVAIGNALVSMKSTASPGGGSPYHEVSVTDFTLPGFTKIRLDLNTVTVNGNLNFANYADAEGGKVLGTDNAGNVILKSGGTMAIKVITGASNPSYTPTTTDQLIYCQTGNGAITINLPEPATGGIGNGKELVIKCIGSNSVTLNSPPPGLDDGAYYTLTDGKYVRMVSSTATGAWIVIGGN